MKKVIGLLLTVCIISINFAQAEIGDKINVLDQSNNKIINSLQTHGEDFDFLVISPEEWKTNFDIFKQHKDNKGIKTIVVSLEEIYGNLYFTVNGRDNQERIKYFIKNAKENWNVQYVMLVGSKEKFPVRYLPYEISSNFFTKSNNFILYNQEFISDLYYADLYDENGSFCSWDSNENDVFGESYNNQNIDQVDFYPDVYIGRIPCVNLEELETVINKIIEYEDNVYGQPWLNNIILCGGDTHPGIYEENIWLLILLSKGLIYRRAFEGEYTCDKVSELLRDYNSLKCYASGFMKPKIKSLTVENINNAINTGGSFFLYVGHGFGNTFGTHPPFCTRIWLPFPNMYTNVDVNDLTNELRLPIAIFSACHCSNFDVISNPIAWKFITHESGGAIASIACTTVSFSSMSTYTIESYNGYLTMGIFRAYNNGIDVLGKIWANSIISYLEDDNVWSDIFPNPLSIHYLTLEEWILFGDPTLKIGGYN